ncbi:hypothetical protein GQ457_01G056430 [Hibiscus cannabinus]
MDPCPFVRLIVESLALKLPQATKPAGSGQRLRRFPARIIHFRRRFPPRWLNYPAAIRQSRDASYRSLHWANGSHVRCPLWEAGGRVKVTVDLGVSQTRPSVFQNGWMKLGKEPEKPTAKLHLTVKAEPDPRFTFQGRTRSVQFNGEPECSPVVFQIQGNIRQPVFSCKFSADRSRSRSLPSDFGNKNSGWMRTLSGEKERQGRERKGWMIMIHDLSGSPVAAASMITPFVPSPSSDRVSRSNPGAWLILRPNGFSVSSWKPWGRLEAWRERGPIDGLGYKFELVTENGPNNGIPIAEATMSIKKGGQFCIDRRVSSDSSAMSLRSPVKGFVMGATVEGEGKISKPAVQVGMQHVTCMADAALFIALSAAIDLSMDACQLFSRKLRKELCHDHDNESFS